MKLLASVCWIVATCAMAIGPVLGRTDAPQGKERKTVPLKVVVLIPAKTKGISEGAKIKQIDTLKEAAVAKKSLADVKEKGGKEVKRLNGTYVVKDATITLADAGVVACQVLVAVEPGKTTLRDVKYVSTVQATSDKKADTWYGYTAVFDTPAPEEKAGENTTQAMTHAGIVRCVAFSPDGKTLASAGDDKAIKLWDVATGKETATLNGHTDWVWSLAYSPDGKTLASGSVDTLKLWDVQTGKERATLKGHAVAFSPDGKTLASGSNNSINLWDMAKVNDTDTSKADPR